MDDPKNLLVSKLKEAKNVLVTVSKNPSVDQLAALMGLTLAIDKSKKHAAAIFSGKVPSTLEFLQPEDTIQTTTDALRDFIVSLDRAKASKLRYTAEEDVVKIYITPYRTSIKPEDLKFEVGDFNVDLVIALGVREQNEIDQAIMSHGSILHDATVATINLSTDAGLGTINWNDESASSLCELVTELVQAMDESVIDGQIATSLLTGIVAETARFSNDKTSSHTMSASAALMTAGANQQLIATQLEQGAAESQQEDDAQSGDQVASDGTLEIDHTSDPAQENNEAENAAPSQEVAESAPENPAMPTDNSSVSPGAKLIIEPPTIGGQLTANSQPEGLSPAIDPLSAGMPQDAIMTHKASPEGKTLADIEREVNSPHLQNQPKTLEDIEKEVNSPHLNQQVASGDVATQDIHSMAEGQEGQSSAPPINMPDGAQAYDTPAAENPGFNANAAPPVPPPLPFNSNSTDSPQ